MKTKVLVVENEVIIADNLCDTLRTLGYDVLDPALSFEMAIESFKKEDIDIAILDIQLGGGKTGIDVARHVKELYDIPFIYLSSHSDTKTLEMAKSTMPYAYLVKPFSAPDVLTAIEIALNNYSRYHETGAIQNTESIPDLTNMEKVIIRLVSENHSTKSIAEKLFISDSTVKNHRHNICVKLNLTAGTHSLLKWAMENKQLLS
jgi:DNA-binding NarL/FixJ family response regulator